MPKKKYRCKCGCGGEYILREFRTETKMLRRTSIQAVLSRQNSRTSNLDLPNFPSPAPPSDVVTDNYPIEFNNITFDNDLPPTEQNIWDDILQHRYHNDELEDIRLPKELDNVSLDSLSDRLGDIDISTYGLSVDELMDAEDIIEAVVEAHTLLEDEDIDNLSSFDLHVRHKPTKALFAFIGYPADMQTCPVCHELRLDSTGKPQNIFTTIPLIPQLRSLLACAVTAKKMRYRHIYINNNTMADIFSSRRYLELRDLFVEIDGKPMPYKYFQEEHEVALGVTLDGACPFKRRTNTCWPIVVINYNLPSDEHPLIDELRELACGVAAVDVTQHKLSSLCAHLLTIFGDIPVLTKVLEFVGHNGCLPCRFCFMPTVPGPTSGGGFRMDPLDLPLREHNQCVTMGLKVLNAKNEAQRKKLATESGIKGVTLFARVPSISIPRSFPVDLMHMISCILTKPALRDLKVDWHLRRQIVRYLTTCFAILSDAAEELIPGELEQWGRLRIGNGGDDIHARGYHKLRADGQDAAFVRYQLMVDQDADDASAEPRFEEESQYGELRHIFVLTIPPKMPKVNPGRKKKQYLLLTQIYEAPAKTDETDEYKIVWYKGRIKDGNMWWIVDRSADNKFAYPEFVD
ncbi:hypothetical protein RSAG8_09620, partial [Rhizoctonia solani AG-8 WAC10335]